MFHLKHNKSNAKDSRAKTIPKADQTPSED